MIRKRLNLSWSSNINQNNKSSGSYLVLNVRNIPDYTSNEIVDIILVLGECHNNYQQPTVLYRNRSPHRRHSNHCMISKLVLRQRQCQRQKR